MRNVRLVVSALLLGACWFLISMTSIGCKTYSLKEVELWGQTGQYSQAAEGYYELYRKTSTKKKEKKSYLAFQAGENYFKSRNYHRAYTAYMAALRLNYPDSIIHLRIAQQLERTDKRKQIDPYLRNFLSYRPQDYFAHLIQNNKAFADSLRTHPTRYVVRKATRLASTSADYAPMFAPDGESLYITSSRSNSPDVSPSPITGFKPSDLYFSKKDAKGKWSPLDSVAGGINTPYDEGCPSFSPDGSTLYYTQASGGSGASEVVKIYTASKAGDGGWGQGQEKKLWNDTTRLASHPAVNGSGSYLYFVSDRGAFGGKDLYRIALGSEYSGEPENLGASINTPGDELFPTMQGDSILYFSSNGYPGMGGFDLFKATLQSDGNWAVENMGYPINSSADDFSFVINPAQDDLYEAQGFLVSNRKDHRGRPSLYEFSLKAIQTTIEGWVMDREELPIAGAVIRVIDRAGNVRQPYFSSKEDGSFSIHISGSNDYLLHASHPDYLNSYVALRVGPSDEDRTYYIDFSLASRLRSERIRDIYFDFDAASLRPESQKSLDLLVTLLEQNPTERIEIGAHTDRKGDANYNLKLSKQRAQSVVKYLVQKGIDPSRLVSEGYGKSVPYTVSQAMAQRFDFLQEGDVLSAEKIQTLTPEQQMICDQLNRRTEFRVVERL